MTTERDDLADIILIHQRRDAGSCDCGWGVLGAPHSVHVADAIMAAGYRKVDPVTEWGVQSKWGQRWFLSKERAMENVEMHESCDERATLIKRETVTGMGPWVVADDER